MTPTPYVPLGFADLTEDESLIVAIFRAWQQLGPTHAIAEHTIARVLQPDTIHPALSALFVLFGSFVQIYPGEANHTEVLSRSEEALLDQLAASEHPNLNRKDVHACRVALQQAKIQLRPLGDIPRSGDDLRLQRISMSYQMLL